MRSVLTAPVIVLLVACTPRPQEEPATGEPVTVVEVVDGDTIRVSGGDSVRLIGIDTPEIEACGYEEATDLLGELVDGADVTLVRAPGQDRDQYGRLLRYVEADGVDVAPSLLEAGLARARFDSEEGYPEHPRERSYRESDSGARDRGCFDR